MKQTTPKSICEIDGHWGSCGATSKWSPYRNGIGTAVAIVTYEINAGSDDNAGEQFSYYVCAECLECEEMQDNEDMINEHHWVNTEYINENDMVSTAKILRKNNEKCAEYHAKHPTSKKMIAKINKYLAIEHSDDWKKTHEEIFGVKEVDN